MGNIDIASMFLLLAIVATGVVAWVAIYSRKRRQTQSTPRRPQQEAKEPQRKIKDDSRLEEESAKAEDERKRVEVEADREAEEEEQRRREQQKARAKAGEDERQRLETERRQLEENLRQIEEERHKTEEKRKRLEEDTRRGAEEAQQKKEAEKQRIEPEKRGGRPRDSTQRRGKQTEQQIKSCRLKPEIVCWKRERRWILAVEMPDELLDKSGLVVLQNASPLTHDESDERCWTLEQAFGQVVVNWNEDGVDEKTEIALGQEGYLLLRLSGQNRGRRMKFPSFGWYLLVVPDNWERDEVLSGPPPVAPEPVSIVGYRGHYFDLEKGSHKQIAFQSAEGTPVLINPNKPRFEVVGTRVIDASEDRGPLFGEKPPLIRALDEQAWKDVETIVVGEEGGGKGRWRTAFSPVLGLIEQDLPPECAASGWYFLRLYDANDDLAESLEFRFVGGLKGIKVHQPSPLPSEAGHTKVSVELFHEPNCRIQPADGLEDSVLIECEGDKTTLAIPPDPTRDETHWLVGPQHGPLVEVTILVERLWWAVAEEDGAPSEWKDTRLTLSRDDFAATSNKAIWVRVPRPRWIDVVSVGFKQPRPYALKVAENTVVIPLRYFTDSQEAADRTREYPLRVWIKPDDRIIEGVIGIIPATVPILVDPESPKSEVQEVALEKRPLLNLTKISAPRLASVLTGLCRVTYGPLRLLIKEVRQKYRRGRSARRTGSVEFVKQALCLIAFSLELGEKEQSQIFVPRNRWTGKARLARDECPEIISRLRTRYEELKTGQARRMREGRRTK